MKPRSTTYVNTSSGAKRVSNNDTFSKNRDHRLFDAQDVMQYDLIAMVSYSRTLFSVVLFSLVALYLVAFAPSVVQAAVDLDEVLQAVASERNHNPFKPGEKAAQKHPIFPTLLSQADHYGSVVEWVPSVSAAVLELPFNESRMKVTSQDEFNGWFDEFEVPNLIYVHEKTSLVTLIHELRHALHVGVHGRIEGNEFDRALQINKRRIDQFHTHLMKSPLDLKTKRRLKILSTRLLETCSEVSAHHGDLLLAEAFRNAEAESHREFIKEYKLEFEKAYKALSRHPFSQGEEFVEDLNQHLAASGF